MSITFTLVAGLVLVAVAFSFGAALTVVDRLEPRPTDDKQLRWTRWIALACYCAGMLLLIVWWWGQIPPCSSLDHPLGWHEYCKPWRVR